MYVPDIVSICSLFDLTVDPNVSAKNEVLSTFRETINNSQVEMRDRKLGKPHFC